MRLYRYESIEFIVDSNPTPEQHTESRAISNTLNAAIDHLSENEALVIRSYYYNSETLSATAERLHISRQRTAQLKDSALKKLRNDPDIIQLYDTLFKS